MKRVIALVLALVLVLAMIPGTAAAKSREDKLTLHRGLDPMMVDTAKILEKVQPYGLMNPTQEDWLNYIIPDFEMYGMSVVQGDVMELTAIIGNCMHYDYLMGVLLYEGHYESLADDAEPIASAVMEPYGVYNAPTGMQWDTTGFAPGDYTVVFCLLDTEGYVYYASLCDVFVSKVKIPLERLGIYVLELDREATTVYEGDNGFSLVPVRYPYHTTERDDEVFFKGHAWTGYGASKFPYGDGITPNGSDIRAYIYRNGKEEFETVLKVIQPEENNRMYFERLTEVYVCFGAEIAYRLHLPKGASMEDVLFQISYPGRAELRVEGDIVYIKSVTHHPGYTYLTASWGDYYATELFLDQDHEVDEWVEREASCTEKGLWVKACIYCGQREQERALPALGHDVAEPTVISEPTATKDGFAAGYCSRCNLDVEYAVSRIFNDTEPGRYYSDPLDYCYKNGIIVGLTDTTFGPSVTLSRAQLVTLLYRHAGSTEVQGENPFSDVPAGKFYTNPVIWASENGIVSGYEDGTFLPDAPITREQIVSILHRYVKSLGRDNGAREDLSAFEDLDQLHNYARESMEWAVANGVVKGVTETQLGPRQSANRGQAVTILYRIITGILAAGE